MLGVLRFTLASEEHERKEVPIAAIPQPNSASERRATDATVAIAEAEIINSADKQCIQELKSLSMRCDSRAGREEGLSEIAVEAAGRVDGFITSPAGTKEPWIKTAFQYPECIKSSFHSIEPSSEYAMRFNGCRRLKRGGEVRG